MYNVICYTDGGCAPNPGIGGWGVKLMCPEINLSKELFGGCTLSTNNRMELTAAIKALESLNPSKISSVTLHTDSKYVTDAFNQKWIDGWVRSNWKNGTLLNLDLWQTLYSLTRQYTVTFVWVKGHNGDLNNEIVDKLCANGRASAIYPDAGYQPPKKTDQQTALAL